MATFYLSFGQSHAHSVNGKTFDKDCIAIINAADYDEARKVAFDAFGPKWAFIYEKEPNMGYYPRGLMKLN